VALNVRSNVASISGSKKPNGGFLDDIATAFPVSRYQTTGRLLSLSKIAHRNIVRLLIDIVADREDHSYSHRRLALSRPDASRDDQPAISVDGDPRPEFALPPRSSEDLQGRFDFRKMTQWFR
jgi:hypothetical protein